MIVIGGGGHGLPTAHYLAKNHGARSIAGLEKGSIGGGNSGRNTQVTRSNHFFPASSAFYDRLLQLYVTLSREPNFNIMLSRRGLIGLAYSGTTTYEGSAEVPDTGPVTGEAVEIDLRNVKSLAEVIVNGHSAGIAWKAPCLLNVTHRLNPGANELSIRATNLWPNRLIGDQQPGAAPVAFATFTPYRPDVSLLESGLLGPVTTLRRTTEIAR